MNEQATKKSTVPAKTKSIRKAVTGQVNLNRDKKAGDKVPASQVEKLEQLPKAAQCKVNALATKANFDLSTGVSSFVDSLSPGGSWDLRVIPEANDLFPFFRAYAKACFQAEAQERIRFIDDIGAARSMLRILGSRIAGQIGADGGTWDEVVNCALFDFGIRETPYVEYDRDVFRRPSSLRKRILIDLKIEAKVWEAKAWRIVGARTDPTRTELGQMHTSVMTAENTPEPSAKSSTLINPPLHPVPFPERAKWLEEKLRERSWSILQLENYRGPSYKSIRKVLAGEKVTAGVLEKLALGLSNKVAEVTSLQIPNK